MALAHPIFIPLYAAAAPGSVLKVISGGSSTIAANELWTTTAGVIEYITNAFVWEGNIYFAVGSGANTGWMSFNPRTNEFHTMGYVDVYQQMIPIGNYVGMFSNAYYQRGPSPLYRDTAGDAVGIPGVRNSWARVGDEVHVTHGAGSCGTHVWSYPFTAVPGYTANPDGLIFNRICAFKGAMYGLNISTGATSYLYKYSGGAWARVGAGFAVTHNADLNVTASSVAFFEVGGKLWFVTTYNTPGVSDQWHRLFEVDEVAGTVTEQNALIPAGWKVIPTHVNRRVFEVIDDTGSARLVYLFGSNTSSAGWDCYEFDGVNLMTLVASGGHRLGLSAGAIWDENAKGCHVVSGVDSIPSSYLTITHKVSDLKNNGLVNVDLRYEDLSDATDFPVHPACTEKSGVGSGGKSNLISKPSGITTLAHLSDAFDDAIINPNLWEIVNIGHTEAGRDYGTFNSANRGYMTIIEQGGSIRFGGTNPAPVLLAACGIGIKSRWGINGAFTAQVILSNLADLSTNASRVYKLVLMVKTATNDGFGIYIWKNVNVLGRGFFLFPNSAPTVSAIGATNLVDGMILQIGRDAAGVFSCILDTAGAAEDVTPALAPAYAGEVQIWLGAFTEAASNWTASVMGPGFSDLAVAGAGALGNYEGSYEHTFMWNHLLDFGANKNTGIVIHADTD